MSDEITITPSSRGWNVLLTVDSDRVSGLAIVDQRVRVGKAGLKMAGIAGLWTDKEHRNKGYASRVMWAAIDEMERRRYDISILFGIEDFYHRYGYAVCFSSPMCQVSTDALPTSRSDGYRVRFAKSKDLPVIVGLYRKSNRDRSATTLRPRSWNPVHGGRDGWRMPRMGRDVERRPGRAIVVEDRRGRMVTYAAFDAQTGHCMVTEVGGSDRMAYPALANRIRRLADEVATDRVRFCLPVDDPFGEYLGRFGCGWSAHFPANSGSMGRLVSLTPTMRKLLPTLTTRLESSGLTLPKNGITFTTDIGMVSLNQTKNGLSLSGDDSGTKISISQIILTQLTFGYRSVDDLLIDDEIRLPKNLIPVISSLFPKSNPYMWWGDRF